MRYAPFFLWIAVIFFLSSGAGSMSETSRFIRPLLVFLFPDASPETLRLYHGYVRKFAHFFEYAVLAAVASRAFWTSSKALLSRYWYLAAFLLVAAVACVDEFSQSFNSARTGAAADVLLDIFGGVFMIGLLMLIKGRRPLRINN